MISALFAVEMHLVVQNRQIIHKTPILVFKVIKDHCFQC